MGATIPVLSPPADHCHSLLLCVGEGDGMNSASSRSKSAVFMLALVLILLGRIAHAEDFWSYRGEITSKGTRSEGFVGDLSYHNTKVPSKLSQIVTPIGEYKYVASGGTPWSHRGWLKTQNLPIAPESNVVFDANKQDEAHWYQDGKRRGTPGMWVYLPAYKYWLDPASMQQFVDTVLKNTPDAETSPLAALLRDSAPPPDKTPEKLNPDSSVFFYTQATEGKGSKSAGERGILLFNNQPLQWVGTLKTPIGTFFFTSSNRLWEPQGWFPADDVNVQDTAIPVTREDLAKGSYEGPRRAGTPTDWCYSPETKTWYAPERLQ
jgi:hypothetical protein